MFAKKRLAVHPKTTLGRGKRKKEWQMQSVLRYTQMQKLKKLKL